MVFVVHGSIAGGDRVLHDDEALEQRKCGDAESGRRGSDGLALGTRGGRDRHRGDGTGAGIVSREKLAARLDTLPQGPVLLRGDSVAFPPGGCAYLHRHQGPGIRRLSEGGIRMTPVATQPPTGRAAPGTRTGRSRCSLRPPTDRPTRFVRVMVLPTTCLGKSSVEYLNEEDEAKPKTQQYKVYADMPLRLATGR